jgi:hypothetical protein
MDGEVGRCLLDAENGFKAGDTKNIGRHAENRANDSVRKKEVPDVVQGSKRACPLCGLNTGPAVRRPTVVNQQRRLQTVALPLS